jgi:hypothetical protein
MAGSASEAGHIANTNVASNCTDDKMKQLTIVIFLIPFGTIGQTLEQRMTTSLCKYFRTIDENQEYDSIFNEFQGKCIPQLLTSSNELSARSEIKI